MFPSPFIILVELLHVLSDIEIIIFNSGHSNQKQLQNTKLLKSFYPCTRFIYPYIL